jgi:hypothetical protein
MLAAAMVSVRCPVERAPLLQAMAYLPPNVFAHIAYWADGGQPAALDDDPRWSGSDRHKVRALQAAAKRYLERPL